jgi:hypothetical protein
MRTLFMLAALALGGVDIYRWTDAEGQRHFSDQPHPGAERITITTTTPATAGSQPASGTGVPAASGAAEPFSYSLIEIQAPAQDEVLWNIEGQLDVVAAVSPPLQPGHMLEIYLDGNRVLSLPPGITRGRLSNVFRGEHRLQATVVNESRETVTRGEVTTFSIRQTSTANPQNPVLNPPPPARP